MKILAVPGFRNRDSNPYNYLLYSHMAEKEVIVEDRLSLSSFLNSDVLHIHWPELFLNYPRPVGAVLRAVKLALVVFMAKLCRLKLIWTVHNLKPHERRYPLASSIFYRVFPRLCDGFIFLSDYTRDIAQETIPSINQSKATVIFHGDYRPIIKFKKSRDECRRDMGVKADEFLVLFFGMIRRYKNVPKLIEEFSSIKSNRLKLFVAGKVVNDDRLGGEIRDLASRDSRINVSLEHVPEDKLIEYLTAADMVVLPYADVANSGSVIMALSVGCRVIAPNKGSLPQVQELVGADWLSLYEGDFSAELLVRAMQHTDKTSSPDLSQFEWGNLADKTLKFMQRL